MKLISNFNGQRTAGIICETEAYCGTNDRGCHAFNGRKTPRTEIMFEAGGVAYIYLCYGIHHLFNVVTHAAGEPHAILIRAIEPLEGIETMLERRGLKIRRADIAGGPGLVSQCLGFTTSHNGISLLDEVVWIEAPLTPAPFEIIESPRVGMNFSGPYKNVPWRFRIAGSPYTSKAR